MDEALIRAKRLRTLKIVAILILIGVLLIPVFWWFRLSSGANQALRKAKNVKIAFTLMDIEYYGEKKEIYNPGRRDGMEEHLKERINTYLSDDGDYVINSYNRDERRVTGFIYKNDGYEVIYSYDQDGDHWAVYYLLPFITQQKN